MLVEFLDGYVVNNNTVNITLKIDGEKVCKDIKTYWLELDFIEDYHDKEYITNFVEDNFDKLYEDYLNEGDNLTFYEFIADTMIEKSIENGTSFERRVYSSRMFIDEILKQFEITKEYDLDELDCEEDLRDFYLENSYESLSSSEVESAINDLEVSVSIEIAQSNNVMDQLVNSQKELEEFFNENDEPKIGVILSIDKLLELKNMTKNQAIELSPFVDEYGDSTIYTLECGYSNFEELKLKNKSLTLNYEDIIFINTMTGEEATYFTDCTLNVIKKDKNKNDFEEEDYEI